ncbi:aspartyl/asparaginyl beta-hydroxylase domain-containing protein [Sphingomonas sp. ST-64]|uniref:Aspartyl/asparaginyl beta-hydroxylase domain-containing protein n=2 Tax=Sphingomonas plantiphila TaxID=3163295 RepID=A0ABW8YL28_9SPHN
MQTAADVQAELPAIVEKPARIRDLGAVDTEALQRMVARLSETAWNRADAEKQNDFECFHSTRHLLFRFTPHNANPRLFDTYPAWHVWKPLLLPVFDHVTRGYGFRAREYPKAMLARLEAGGTIDRHVDGGESDRRAHKIHVPLQTNPKALIVIEGEPFHLRAGHAYEVNNVVRHAVENFGDEDRIHLVFEVFDDARSGQVSAHEHA